MKENMYLQFLLQTDFHDPGSYNNKNIVLLLKPTTVQEMASDLRIWLINNINKLSVTYVAMA